jgi:hypothetical protein
MKLFSAEREGEKPSIRHLKRNLRNPPQPLSLARQNGRTTVHDRPAMDSRWGNRIVLVVTLSMRVLLSSLVSGVMIVEGWVGDKLWSLEA